MATHDTIISDKSLTASPDGFIVDVQIPWYRSLWLSAVSDLRVSIDGVEVPQESLRVALNGSTYAIDELPAQWDQLWFLQDRARVHATSERVLAPGDEADITVDLDLRIHYMQIAPQQYIRNHVVSTKRLTARAEEK